LKRFGFVESKNFISKRDKGAFKVANDLEPAKHLVWMTRDQTRYGRYIMSKGNSVLQIQVVTTGKTTALLGKDGVQKVLDDRGADFEAMLRKALDEGKLSFVRSFSQSSNGNLIARSGAIHVDLVTCDKPTPKTEEEPSKATKAEMRKELLAKIL
jgi:hypothetical protein